MIVNKSYRYYYQWLCDMVRCGEKNKYYKLTMKLHNTPFTYLKSNVILSRDSSREDDGFELRIDFVQDKHTNITNIEGECSVFEMLIALSRRIDDLCTDSLADSNIDKWFWRLLTNLKLNNFNDNNFDEKKVEDILKTLMSRKYDKFGNGGLFPIPKYKGDMRKIDIAMQMHHYLNYNNYRI